MANKNRKSQRNRRAGSPIPPIDHTSLPDSTSNDTHSDAEPVRCCSGFVNQAKVMFVFAVITILAVGFALFQRSTRLRSGLPEMSSVDSADAESPVRVNNSVTATVPRMASQFSTPTRESNSQTLNQFVDPGETDWQTESFSDAANQQLATLARLLEQNGTPPLDWQSLETIFTTNARCTPLRPQNFTLALRDKSITVRRLDHGAPRDGTSREKDQLALYALQQFLPSEDTTFENHVKLKVYRVQQTAEGFSTSISVEAWQHNLHGNTQINADWQCNWQTSKQVRSSNDLKDIDLKDNSLSGSDLPRILSITVQDHEEVTTEKQGRWLVDCTASVLGGNRTYSEQFLVGTDAWVNRLDRRLTISRFGHHGLAVADVNGDGREDLYVCQPGGLPNCLYVQQSDGTARDVSADAGIDFLDYSSSAIFADMDNDGDQDLVLASVAALTVWTNDGDCRFQPTAAMTECPTANSLAVADFDGDGLLDIFACRYRATATELGQFPLPMPYFDANNGGRNFLYRNLGNGQFADVTHDAGIDENNTRFSYAAAWEDYDNDGDADLYVANDFGRNCLYQNTNGHFADVAVTAGVEDIASGMSVSWSDFDHDGHMDIYVSNMFSSAGNRIAFQDRLESDFSEVARAQIQRHARGNTLYRNLGDGTFRDVSLSSGVTRGRWAWGSVFADINNDGWDDILVANGLLTTDDTGDL